ncbi:MAG: ribonuclease HII [Vampirovibrionales bacterium]|nr:ribonuclease HII [Vampirovibrionales bacterium]
MATLSKSGKPSKLPDLLAFDADVLAERPAIAWLAGIDEVGRGSCMGPVVAAAVLVPRAMATAGDKRWASASELAALDDSKKLAPDCRERLSGILRAQTIWGVGEASVEEIARLNIAQASLLAGARALAAAMAAITPSPLAEEVWVLIDGRMRLPDWPKERQQPVIQGDGRSFAIAAASVIAKQARDAWAIQAACDYPVYGWERNMGYPTPAHKAALLRYGPTPLHRPTYEPVRRAMAVLPCRLD